MIIYGLIAYLGFILMVIGYFFVKKSGDKDTSTGQEEQYGNLVE